MPKFLIEAGGAKYEIEAPDENAALAALDGGAQPAMTLGEKAVDVAKSLGIGGVEGALGIIGTGGDIDRLSGASSRENLATNPLVERLMGKSPEWARLMGAKLASPEAQRAFNPTSADLKRDVESVTGQFYEPQSTEGEFARTVGTFAPGAMAGPGGVVRNLAQFAVVPGLASEAAGQLTKGTKAEPWARAGAALVSPSVAGRVLTPVRSQPSRAELVKTLEGEGIDALTAGERTGSKALRYMESSLGDAPFAGGKATAAADTSGQQFTQAVMRRAGSEAPLATQENVAKNAERIGKVFEDLSANNTLLPDRQLAGDMGRVLNQYSKILGSEQKAKVNALVDDIVEKFQQGSGRMSGEEYQAARSRLSRLAQNNRLVDPDYSEALRGLRDALDKGMRRNIRPEDAGKWDRARLEYAGQKVVERAASAGGENAARGILSPTQVRMAAAAGNRGAFARGQGQFAELASAAEGIMKPLPQSGTGPRLQASLMALGGALGGAGGSAAGPLGSVAGAAFGALAPMVAQGVAGRALMSRPVQAYLGNRIMPARERADAIVKSILAQRAALEPTLRALPQIEHQNNR